MHCAAWENVNEGQHTECWPSVSRVVVFTANMQESAAMSDHVFICYVRTDECFALSLTGIPSVFPLAILRSA